MLAQDPPVFELRMFPDYGADPVWAGDGMVDLDTLPISSVHARGGRLPVDTTLPRKRRSTRR